MINNRSMNPNLIKFARQIQDPNINLKVKRSTNSIAVINLDYLNIDPY